MKRACRTAPYHGASHDRTAPYIASCVPYARSTLAPYIASCVRCGRNAFGIVGRFLRA